MSRSSAVQSFRRYLTINAEHLGIIDISEVILDDHSPGPLGGVPKVLVTPAHHGGLRTSLHAHVLSIHLTYDWKPLSKQSSGLSIFSPQTLLPLQPALNKVMRKLFSFHIVGRYPWLFGPLRTKLHIEHQWFPSLVRSLLAIADRSENSIFRNKAQALMKKIENHILAYKQR
ncbi:hypothetical protein BJV74DRAFT_378112 [Russula compacta]|nr:hypothetical protein BJV74DRAFT_378112 [Russula compacta]